MRARSRWAFRSNVCTAWATDSRAMSARLSTKKPTSMAARSRACCSTACGGAKTKTACAAMATGKTACASAREKTVFAGAKEETDCPGTALGANPRQSSEAAVDVLGLRDHAPRDHVGQ